MRSIKLVMESLSNDNAPKPEDYPLATKSSYEGFRTDTTGMSYYDNFLDDPSYMKNNKYKVARIVEMSPDEYLRLISKYVFNRDYDKVMGFIIHSNNKDGTDELVDKMKNGVKMKLPFIDIDNRQQEGRHRAYAAKLLGIDIIPVLFIRNLTKDELKDTVYDVYKNKFHYDDDEISEIYNNILASYSESWSSDFINNLYKISDKSVITELNELCESLNVRYYEDIEPELERLAKVNIHFNVKDDPSRAGWYNKLTNKWKSVKNSVKKLIKL